ncbi:hypothetical protein F5Y16DRAFT_406200 [Xylariaceae sp. FL0255]|nr:hypothetical protein F5Y16DRAFT_406200 [Xylariaceae sp. FL0255]
MAVAKVNWEKLATRTGFKDGTTAKAHYEPLLKPDQRPSNAPKNRQIARDGNGASIRVKTQVSTHHPSELDDGEV